MRVRVRARQSLTGSPPVPASRAAAAAPQLHPRPGPAPGPSPAAPHGAVSHRRAGVCGGEHPEEARAEGQSRVSGEVERMAPQVQHMGARGAHPGPPPCHGLRGEGGERPSIRLSEERSKTQATSAAGNHCLRAPPHLPPPPACVLALASFTHLTQHSRVLWNKTQWVCFSRSWAKAACGFGARKVSLRWGL